MEISISNSDILDLREVLMKRQLLLALMLLVYAPVLQAQVSRQIEPGEAQPAQGDHREAIMIKQGPAKTYLNRGLVRSAAGEWDGAISDFNKVIEIEPLNAAAYYNRGNVRQARGERDEAIADYDEAIRINPGLAEAYNNRGVAKASER
jgi:tetratricopeptide (TPR) repeat protein